MQQVVTISPDGTISGLQRKAGQGLDLRTLGKASIERVSEIKWDEDRQAWYVEVISGPLTNLILTAQYRHKVAGLEGWFPEGATISTGTGILYFDDYDDAVRAEVEFLDAMRLKGVF